ncbi:MAG: hypothetical protein RM022_003090 [Nostoc sp. EfeVER01]|uniref:hypothetical protein n=1 Tax=unclassified Nostoc TaxID=2593658 RepID=UPI002AD564DE|nr:MULTISPECIES: hypothetical protein [unclassified Nostoc]MDZ7945108.1 hypothetical protein [Nostoc sp. EfeVER01]MDZ7995855.1 hypothetical protein [Nostoc sp. EspVER01]
MTPIIELFEQAIAKLATEAMAEYRAGKTQELYHVRQITHNKITPPPTPPRLRGGRVD